MPLAASKKFLVCTICSDYSGCEFGTSESDQLYCLVKSQSQSLSLFAVCCLPFMGSGPVECDVG
jgi:hypothetical protein